MDILQRIKKVANVPLASDCLVKMLLDQEISTKNYNLSKVEVNRSILTVAQKIKELYDPIPKKNINLALKLINNEDGFNVKDILSLDPKIKHRINFYDEICREISNLGIEEVVELNCGFEPLVFKNLNFKIYAVDPQPDVLFILESLFPDINVIEGDCFEFSLKSKVNCILALNCQKIVSEYYNLFLQSLKSIGFDYVIFAFRKKTNYIQTLNKLKKDLKMEKSFETKNEVFYIFKYNS